MPSQASRPLADRQSRQTPKLCIRARGVGVVINEGWLRRHANPNIDRCYKSFVAAIGACQVIVSLSIPVHVDKTVGAAISTARICTGKNVNRVQIACTADLATASELRNDAGKPECATSHN